MTDRSVFAVIGPVMIGPSSSHTAGAVRIGRIARSILNEEFIHAEITLYGSFAKTYQGHGTDRALVGGAMGMDTDDDRIKEALDIAAAMGLTVVFGFAEEGHRFPNTAGILLTGISGRKTFIEGSSVGGGNVIINRVNEFNVDVSGKYPTLLVEHRDKPGVIGRVATILGQNDINIGQMTVARYENGAKKLMVAETNQIIPKEVLKQISCLPEVAEAVKFGPV